MHVVTTYQCGYCGAIFTTSHQCFIHEDDCMMNPKKQGCLTCKHYKNLEGSTIYGCNIKEMIGYSSKHYKKNCEKWERA